MILFICEFINGVLIVLLIFSKSARGANETFYGIGGGVGPAQCLLEAEAPVRLGCNMVNVGKPALSIGNKLACPADP